MSCDQCEVVVIQGVPCHEHNCPNSWCDPITMKGYERCCTWCDKSFIPERKSQLLCKKCLYGLKRLYKVRKTMIGITTKETIHGEIDKRCTLPKGIKVLLMYSNNLPKNSEIMYWARPIYGHPWPIDTEIHARRVGVGLYSSDVDIVE